MQGDLQKAQGVRERRVGDHEIDGVGEVWRRAKGHVVAFDFRGEGFGIKPPPSGVGVLGTSATQTAISGPKVEEEGRKKKVQRRRSCEGSGQ